MISNADAAAAQNNNAAVTVPAGWGYPAATYAPNAFYEGYIDLASINGEIPSLCFGSFMLETRSSQSLTASLDDFVGGAFSTIPEITVNGANECADPTGAAIEMQLCAFSDEMGLEYQWYSAYVDENNNTPIPGATNSCYTVSVTATTNYWVTATNEIGCVSEVAMVTATINPNRFAKLRFSELKWLHEQRWFD
jgi:hypothetical protein